MTTQEDSGKKSPVTKVYNSSSSPGFVKWYIPSHGWALAYQQSVEDEEPYFLYDSGGSSSSVQLQQSKLSQLTDNAFFWDISGGNGGITKNTGTGKCLLMATVSAVNSEHWHFGANGCGPNGLLDSIHERLWLSE